MALSIITPIPTTCYTSQLQTIEIQATATKFQLLIYHTNSSTTTDPIFSNYYYPQNAKVVIYEIGSLLETYMHNLDGVQQFTIRLSDGYIPTDYLYTVVSCKQQPTISAETLINKHFLINTNSVLIGKNTTCKLPFFYNTNGQATFLSLIFKIYYKTDSNLNKITLTARFSIHQTGVNYIEADYQTIYNFVSSQLPANAEILSYSVSIGERTCTFFVYDQSALRHFYFRNAYNCLQHIYIPTKHITKTETTYSTANFLDTITQYDITHSRTFEETTPVLQLAQAHLLEELLTSPEIFVFIDETPYPILIIDYTLELSDNPGDTNQITFKWQFATKYSPFVPNLDSRIFTQQFTEPFV